MGFGAIVTTMPCNILNDGKVREKIRKALVKAIEKYDLEYIYIPDDGPELVYLKEVINLVKESYEGLKTLMPIVSRNYLGASDSVNERFIEQNSKIMPNCACVIVAGGIPAELEDLLKNVVKIEI